MRRGARSACARANEGRETCLAVVGWLVGWRGYGWSENTDRNRRSTSDLSFVIREGARGKEEEDEGKKQVGIYTPFRSMCCISKEHDPAIVIIVDFLILHQSSTLSGPIFSSSSSFLGPPCLRSPMGMTV
ncbi:hypothetical protein LX36DRAFT_655218 [Colletotrichum falcatum]|nr:hypothetical protein LX36DRAFT_655218 [Colletotrichum falcatum]